MPEFSTAQVHAGESRDAAHGARVTPIYLTAGFRVRRLRPGRGPVRAATRRATRTAARATRRPPPWSAGSPRSSTAARPSRSEAARRRSPSRCSGWSQAGDHILSAQSIYSGTRGLFENGLAPAGRRDRVRRRPDRPRRVAPPHPPEHPCAVRRVDRRTPATTILDIEGVAAVAHEQRHPADRRQHPRHPVPSAAGRAHGADIVVHSASKYLGGHGSTLGGVIVDRARTTGRVVAVRRT